LAPELRGGLESNQEYRGDAMSSKITSAKRYAVAVAVAAVFAAAAFTAHAQVASTSSGALEEIVVTAQKREQNSQDIGISTISTAARRKWICTSRRTCWPT
jgi:outer membrane receptor protein involved in Fe transport